ncbi:MAG: hypothetical protein QG623_482 [Patescibacteria group bacterium]|nr:hypothetical protein [Patescibacteria group bacterium]
MISSDAILQYLSEVEKQFLSGHAREHAYRPALQRLMESFEDTTAVNDPARSQHGMPDFVFLKSSNQKIIKGYAEAKDITVSLDKTEKTDQMDRYHGYANLYLTDYLEFRFFKNGEKYKTISLGQVVNGALKLTPQYSEELARELKQFLELPPEEIKSGRRLAEIMGGKARRVRDNVALYLEDDSERNKELEKMYTMMKELLVHDLEKKKFADMYAQTLVYGLFVARYADKSSENFSRQEARDLVPKSNPFLRKFFDHIAGSEFDERLGYIVDELCEVFQVSNVKTLIQKHLKLIEFKDGQGDEKDPIIHFYEDFLKEYDPLERKRMGAYYTPIPVVKFMINQVDKILKEEFGLAKGLADTSKINHTTTNTAGEKFKNSIHRVQILDPAVGTATFLNETIKFIHQGFKGQEGRWPSYAERDLLPRLHGFELMMAPYTIAHLKLGMTLQETGLEDFAGRLGVYLTNTLEEGSLNTPDLFSQLGFVEALTAESKEASRIKHKHPIMLIIGNPPYSISSNNKSKHILELIKVYKKDLNERKINLDDDYIKFIRFSEDLIAKNGEGIVAMITNNSYIDGITHRQMRKHLLQTFDKIFVLDLHGNSKKKEVSPDGSKDENVFDIMQGVSIVLMVKNKKKRPNQLGQVYHSELYGKRKLKFSNLSEDKIKLTKLEAPAPNHFFVPKNMASEKEYNQGVNINELFITKSSGFRSGAAASQICFDKQDITKVVHDLINLSETEFRTTYKLKDGRNHNYKGMREDIGGKIDENKIIQTAWHGPFDIRWTYYSYKSSGFVAWPRNLTMNNFVNKANIGLMYMRGHIESKGAAAGVTNLISSERTFSRPGMSSADSVAPLYIYHDDGTKTPNFDLDELKKFTKNLKNEPQPEDVLDYIYSFLHSPSYRDKYKEFLKIDFPRVPIPKDDKEFTKFRDFGTKLRSLHLMTDPSLDDYITTYSEAGSDEVERIKFEADRVYINSEQYFGNVPEVAWNFYIGGYQPAQKWLKDRKERKLNSDDIDHYQKIIKVLVETDKIMKQIG